MPDSLRDNLGYFFRDSVIRAPRRTALIDLWDERERRLTYAELDVRMEALAGGLQALGLVPGTRIALLIGNRVEYLEAFFGAMRAGLVPVPLNPRQTLSNLDFMIADAGAEAAILDPAAVEGGAALVERLGLGVRVTLGEPVPPGWLGYAALIDRAATPTPALSPDGIAFQPYTAGSTGRPKGVRLTHSGMVWSIVETQARWPMAESEIGLVAVPLFHKNAMRGMIKPVLYAGAMAIIQPRFDPIAYVAAMARYRVTFSGGVPAIFSMLLPHADALGAYDLSSVRSLVIGSAVVTDELVRSVEALFPKAKVKESYGLTEGGGPLRVPADGRKVPRGSAGMATPGYDVKLVGADGREAADKGELWARSPCNTAGYHNRPDLTAERIVDGWLRTGDVFERDAEGFYFFRGRVDDMFSCGGENIYPREVEERLLSHPDVIDACVVALPHPVKGFVPGAIVVLRAGSSASAEALKAHTLAKGPAYAHARRIVLAAEIPLSGAGKPDRAAIRARLLADGAMASE